MGNPVQNL